MGTKIPASRPSGQTAGTLAAGAMAAPALPDGLADEARTGPPRPRRARVAHVLGEREGAAAVLATGLRPVAGHRPRAEHPPEVPPVPLPEPLAEPLRVDVPVEGPRSLDGPR